MFGKYVPRIKKKKNLNCTTNPPPHNTHTHTHTHTHKSKPLLFVQQVGLALLKDHHLGLSPVFLQFPPLSPPINIKCKKNVFVKFIGTKTQKE